MYHLATSTNYRGAKIMYIFADGHECATTREETIIQSGTFDKCKFWADKINPLNDAGIYRFLQPHDIIKEGDQIFSFGRKKWVLCSHTIGETVGRMEKYAPVVFRRKNI